MVAKINEAISYERHSELVEPFAHLDVAEEEDVLLTTKAAKKKKNLDP